jgi:hypothetical protein
MANDADLSTIVRSTHAYPTWNEDLTAASLEDLQTLGETAREVEGPLIRALDPSLRRGGGQGQANRR